MRERKGISTRQERKIWAPEERSLVYLGAEGKVIYYSDGISDHLVFVFIGFPLGRGWKKLKGSILSLKRRTGQGRYEVKLKEVREEVGKAEIVHFPEKGFEEIWKDVTSVLTQKPGLVELGEAKEIREFTLQDLLVEN